MTRREKNLKPVAYWLVSQNCVIRILSGPTLPLYGEIKYKDMIQKTDWHYRNRSIENNTKPINAMVRRGSILDFRM